MQVVIDESKEIKIEEGKESIAASRSLTETIRNVDIGKTKLELMVNFYLFGSKKKKKIITTI